MIFYFPQSDYRAMETLKKHKFRLQFPNARENSQELAETLLSLSLA
jgi:hypothetical protein